MSQLKSEWMTPKRIVAAIYARRSKEQHVAEEAKSVTRQIANAKEFATLSKPYAERNG